MTSLTLNNGDAALKTLYRPENFQRSTYDRRPMLGSLPKDEKFFGRDKALVNYHGNPQGGSADFGTAQANASVARIEDFILTRIEMHQVATINGHALDAMSNDMGSFISAIDAQCNGAIRALSDQLESHLPGDGTGALAQVGSLSSTLCTLKNVNDIFRFEVGMKVVANDGAAGDSLEDSGAGEVIAGVNRRDGILTSTSVAWTTVITGLDADDWLSIDGNAADGGANVVTSGYAAWLPATAPTSGDSFFSVDRSSSSRLYGCYHDGSGGGLVKTALIDGQSVGSTNGGKPDVAFLHHVKNRQLLKELDSQTTYCKSPSRGPGGKEFASVSYEGVVLRGDEGPVTVLAANKMPSEICFMLEMSTWSYGSIGQLVKFNTGDGNKVLRQGALDGVEARFVHRGNLGCKNPGYNVHIAL